jgi:hypothetical protein
LDKAVLYPAAKTAPLPFGARLLSGRQGWLWLFGHSAKKEPRALARVGSIQRGKVGGRMSIGQKLKVGVAVFVMSLTFCLGLYAAVPRLISYQGRLTDAEGLPLTGTYQVTFRLYDAATAGNLLWEEVHAGVVVDKGIFSSVLGSISTLNLAFDKSYYLEIKVGSEVMSPRQPITSSGYAIRSDTSDNSVKFSGKTPSDFALAGDITATPAANKALRLDGNAKLSSAVLKTYDSGWFAIIRNNKTVYTKTHNLGTTKVICRLYGATDSSGTNMGEIQDFTYNDDGAKGRLQQITATAVKVLFHPYDFVIVNSARKAPTHARIIILALE